MAFFAKKTRLKFQYLASFSLIALVITFRNLKGDYNQIQDSVDKKTASKEEQKFMNNGSTKKSCDLFSGRWVYDDTSRPPYNYTQCSFMFGEYDCEKYGRKESKYQSWRWQPNDCDLPRFNGTALLEKIRGKKLVFVGDSLNRNQWTSLLCLIESSIPPSSPKSVTREDNSLFFQAIEYNVTIGLHWSPFLVESNNDDIFNHSGQRNGVVRINSIEKHAIHWTDADFLIFDTFAWWIIQPKITLLWGTFGSPNAINKTVETGTGLRHYEMVLDTWSNWLEFHINRTRTNLFFMSGSPIHDRWGGQWSKNHHCYNETEPILEEEHLGAGAYRSMMEVVESRIHKLERRGVKVQYLNITQLSDYRKDAHPSIYKSYYQSLTEEKKNPYKYSDCLHWCLPGVPDIWNQILSVYVMNLYDHQ